MSPRDVASPAEGKHSVAITRADSYRGAEAPPGIAMLVVAEAFLQEAAREAVSAAGGSVQTCIDWREAASRLASDAFAGVVLADASGADDAAVTAALPLLDALAAKGDAIIVLAIDLAQIDLVSASLGAPGITLLCAPSDAERILALAVAGGVGGRVQDSGREVEADRLRRLNEEVARIAETLARLTRRDNTRPPEALAEPGVSYRVPPAIVDASPIAARDIRAAIRARRLRDQYFGAGLFEDPAWDMLLDLFAAELERGQVSVSSLCIAAAVAPTTALRWIARMSESGILEREADPFDRRRAFMRLSSSASAAMRSYVAAVRSMGTGIA